MSVDLALTASCGCFVTSLSGRANDVPCRPHSTTLLQAFDRPDGVLDQLLAEVYDDGALERVRAVLVEWDRVSKGESPTTAAIRAAIAGVHVDGSST